MTAVEHFRQVLELLGVEPSEDIDDTPERWCRAFGELTSGYKESPRVILSKTFACEQGDELVILKDIEFTSLCEHHLLPFMGVAHVGYLPETRVVGLSKLARLVDCYAKRLQLQERMTRQIGNAIEEVLGSTAVGVVIEAHHSCMGCRGVKKPRARMVTSCLLGRMRTDAAMRSEFMSLVT